ncbi:MAG TPA: hypothetical protein VGF59_06220 [Bryobacteraceae bacterium]
MNYLRWRRAAVWAAAGAATLALSLLALEGAIRLDARTQGDRAAARFGGDRIAGLAALVGCDGCGLREREMAAWALGELRDRRALPVLRAHFTGGRCDHATRLCQYELGKAIMRIEGTWTLKASNRFRRTHRLPEDPTR